MTTLFRFDDCSINTDARKLSEIVQVIEEKVLDVRIMFAISPIVFSFSQLGEKQDERVHPTRLTAHSKLSPYYRGQQCGLPHAVFGLSGNNRFTAGHGLMHVDHRLLGRKAQEMSILGSCALAQSTIFVPPYNKYNDDTISICNENGIGLVRFEDGWQHVLYSAYDKAHPYYYLHSFDTTPERMRDWFEGGKA
jgi:hypothetical protein